MRSSRDEFAAGAREVSPVLVGLVPFGLVAGVAATASGLTPLQGFALSALSFSGIAQLIVCQLIAAKSPAIVVVAAGSIVSLRFVMYSASVSPHLAHLDRRWRALLAFLMTDQSFAMATARFSAPGDAGFRHWHTLGASITLYLAWQFTVAVGIAVGAQVPGSWSLDFAVVLTFIALLVPAVRTRADLGAAIVAGAVALIAAGLPYRLALVAASLAGIAAGMAMERSRRRRERVQ
ncbi:MAG TPA: AzlC family ABC transporter permease [Usitatibacter sp.]|jgi:predicted branched-subunit amino acid permease|nr:AzlC family ABC transporter permease [Usitatibacter sp.]